MCVCPGEGTVLIYQVGIWEGRGKTNYVHGSMAQCPLSIQPGEGASPSGESCQVAANKAWRGILTLSQGA